MFIPVDIGNRRALNCRNPTKGTAAHKTRKTTKYQNLFYSDSRPKEAQNKVKDPHPPCLRQKQLTSVHKLVESPSICSLSSVGSSWTCGGLSESFIVWSLRSPSQTERPVAPMRGETQDKRTEECRHGGCHLSCCGAWKGISHYAASQLKCHSSEWGSNWIGTAILEVWVKLVSLKVLSSRPE